MLIYLCVCVFISCVSSQPSNGLHGDPIEAECLTFFNRERIWVPVALEHVSPPTTGSGSNQINLARHHIIPVRTLRNFFDTAIRQNHEGNVELTGFMSLLGFLADDALNQYGHTDSIDQFIRNDLENIRDLHIISIDQEFNYENPPVDILFDAQYLVRSMYQWIPANIFIGPSPELRSDDPGDAFELNSRYIIGDASYQRLVTINSMMNSYVQTHERATFNEVIELLAEISRARDAPYPFDPSQWLFESNKYKINTNPNPTPPNPRKGEIPDVTYIGSDPYCMIPLETIKMTMEEDNILVISEVLDRTMRQDGFSSKAYASWKDWYASLTWKFGIYFHGMSMAGALYIYDAYGYTFEDNSFAVGILGTDAYGKNDNWITLQSDFGHITNRRDCAGQVFFDQNGRPVAIVITNNNWSDIGLGWSFIYNNGKWEYESSDNWHERRFSGNTLSLDPYALQFVRSKK